MLQYCTEIQILTTRSQSILHMLSMCVSLCVCVCTRILSRFSHVPFFVTLWTVACQTSLFKEFPSQEYWSGLPCPSPGDLADTGIKPRSLMSPTMAGSFSTTSDHLVSLTLRASFSKRLPSLLMSAISPGVSRLPTLITSWLKMQGFHDPLGSIIHWNDSQNSGRCHTYNHNSVTYESYKWRDRLDKVQECPKCRASILSCKESECVTHSMCWYIHQARISSELWCLEVFTGTSLLEHS